MQDQAAPYEAVLSPAGHMQSCSKVLGVQKGNSALGHRQQHPARPANMFLSAQQGAVLFPAPTFGGSLSRPTAVESFFISVQQLKHCSTGQCWVLGVSTVPAMIGTCNLHSTANGIQPKPLVKGSCKPGERLQMPQQDNSYPLESADFTEAPHLVLPCRG